MKRLLEVGVFLKLCMCLVVFWSEEMIGAITRVKPLWLLMIGPITFGPSTVGVGGDSCMN